MAQRNPNKPPKITAEELLLAQDKEYRMKHFYFITDKNLNLSVFVQNAAQVHFNQNKANRNIILKARQLGFTTLSVIDMVDDTLFNQNFNSLLISYDKDSALDIFDGKVMLAWEHHRLKNFYDIDTERANKLKVSFRNGSYSSISVKHSGRSGTFNRVHISEFAKICARYPQRAQEIITGTIPSVPLDGRLDIESTAEGELGSFANMFWEAWNRPIGSVRRPTEFKAHFYNWQWDLSEISKISQVDAQLPKEFRDYQKKHNERVQREPQKYQAITDIQLTYYFYKWLSLEKKWDKLFQEYPTVPEEAFRASGAKLFDQEKVEALKGCCTIQGDEVGSWVFYKPYIPGHSYAMGADPAEGVGGDSSAAVVWDFTPAQPEVVAVYHNNYVAPDIFAYELLTGGKFYGFCLIAVERNNHGHATLTQLKQIYPPDMIYKTIRSEKILDVETEKMGWETNLVTKPKMMYDLVTATNDALIKVFDPGLVYEMRVYDRGLLSSTKADENMTQHFDVLTATAIGFQMKSHLSFDNAEVYTVTSSGSTGYPNTNAIDRFSAL